MRSVDEMLARNERGAGHFFSKLELENMECSVLKNKRVYVPTSTEELCDWIVAQDSPVVVSVNAECLLREDSEFDRVINGGVGYPDGIGCVMLLKLRGFAEAIKIPGVELWLTLLRRGAQKVFLIGGTQESIAATQEAFTREFGSERLVGYSNGFFDTAEKKDALIGSVRRARPEVVVIGMGQPKQEILAQELRSIQPAIYLCVGGSFDVYSGLVSRAPRWMINIGLEWLYRLFVDPRRIGRYMRLLRFVRVLWDEARRRIREG